MPVPPSADPVVHVHVQDDDDVDPAAADVGAAGRSRAPLGSGAVDALRSLAPGRALALVPVLAAVAGVALLGWALLRPAPAAPELALPLAGAPAAPAAGGREPPAAPSATPTASAGAGVVTAHVAGAVRRPGVYELPAGSRVVDLVAVAGGLAEGADDASLALARPLADGETVRVLRVGEVPPVPPPAPPGAAGPAAPAGPLDLNAATASELEALPSVGPATAAAIVQHREQHGRFRAVDELLEVRGIGPARLEQLRPLVRV